MSVPTIFGYKYRIEENVKNVENRCCVHGRCHDITSWVQYHILLTSVDIIKVKRVRMQLSSIFGDNLIDEGTICSSESNSSIIWCVLSKYDSIQIDKFENLLGIKEMRMLHGYNN